MLLTGGFLKASCYHTPVSTKMPLRRVNTLPPSRHDACHSSSLRVSRCSPNVTGIHTGVPSHCHGIVGELGCEAVQGLRRATVRHALTDFTYGTGY